MLLEATKSNYNNDNDNFFEKSTYRLLSCPHHFYLIDFQLWINGTHKRISKLKLIHKGKLIHTQALTRQEDNLSKFC